MVAQVPFIGRQEELFLIEKLVNVWNSLYIVFIDGEGGIGKTRLLEEIYSRFDNKQAGLIITKPIDFDNTTYHVAEKLGIEIAQLLDKKEYFVPFQEEMLIYRKMEMTGVSHQRLSKGFEDGIQLFIDCFNKLSEKNRIVLMCDTIEKIQKADYIRYITETFSKLQNCLIIMAGRSAASIAEPLKTEHNDKIHVIELLPLNDDHGGEYCKKKQESLNINLSPDLTGNIIKLSGGKPIIIDLAIDWLSRDIPPDWLINYSIENNKSLKTDFERELVLLIVQTRSEIEKLILLMAHVYPLKLEAITKLLNKTESESAQLFDEVQKYVFVKTLPDNRITLHDEMRRMVNLYAWPEVDPEGQRRKRYSELFTEIIEKKIELNEKDIIEYYEKERQDAIKNNLVQEEINVFSKQIAIEEEIWLLKVEHLKHTLFLDIDKGVNVFIDAFDSATRQNRLNYREMLIIQIQDQDPLYPFSCNQLYEIDIRRIENWLYKGEYPKAKEIVDYLLNRSEMNKIQLIEIMLKAGNIEIRLGNYKNGIHYFQQAVDICKGTDVPKPYLMRATNALGWGYRLTGNYELAIEKYNIALELSIDLKEKITEAWILNNLSFAYAKNNNPYGAFNLAREAEKIWNILNDDKGKGSLYHVYAEINRVDGRFDEAIEDCEKGIRIFERLGDIDWLNNMYLQRASVYFRRADYNRILGKIKSVNSDLDKAEKDFRKILDTKGQHRIEALHYIGHVYLSRYHVNKDSDNFKESRLCFEKVYQKSKDTFFNVVQLSTLGSLANIAVIQLEESFDHEKAEFQLKYFQKEYDDYEKEWKDIGIPRDLKGLLLKYMGDLCMLYQDDNHIESALNYYCESIPLIATHGRFSTYSFEFQIKDIDKRISKLKKSTEMRMKLGKLLNDYWESTHKLNQMHPEARRYIRKWHQGEDLNE